ncbi:transcriptional regulator [Pelagibacterium lentulum]|uniref:HTH cro/C1-type domain-containing protein n=1 Tax=Pelagibacterium lentulum TaxID=2029865 RepID=A0A916RSP4_9HYPH|nr:YdaS family helix-turn-helix protein [Pelagibacterium lentulum]GGA64662.1 hypothetical protein GCM10011499_38910 [Pelagibacterium lentulum]
MDNKSPLQKAIDEAGSQAALASKIGVSQAHISYWLTKAKRGVPAEYARKVAEVTGVPVHELRPDLYASEDAA